MVVAGDRIGEWRCFMVLRNRMKYLKTTLLADDIEFFIILSSFVRNKIIARIVDDKAEAIDLQPLKFQIIFYHLTHTRSRIEIHFFVVEFFLLKILFNTKMMFDKERMFVGSPHIWWWSTKILLWRSCECVVNI